MNRTELPHRDTVAQTIAAALFGPTTFDLWSPDYQAEILTAADAVLAAAGARADAVGEKLPAAEIAESVARGLDEDGDGRGAWTVDYAREMDGVASALLPILGGDDV